MSPLADDPVVAEVLSRCRFPEARHHDVAVSGGADSLALLALAVSTGSAVTAHHVDHGLRPGGDDEAEAVQGVCRQWGAAFEAHSVGLADGPDLEARCRQARLAVLPVGCLTGHTADDQAETVLLRLARGTGPAGLAAMDSHRHPLLELRRTDTEGLCAHLGVTPLVDPTNDSPRFTRNRIRHEVLPLLAEVTGRDVVPLVNRTAELLRSHNAAIGELAAGIDPRDVDALRSVPTPVATEALRVWWTSETDGLPPPGRAATQRMLDVVEGAHRGCEVTAGWRLDRRGGRLRLTAGSGGLGG